jgi:integrase/recombinase XerC/integrase/recombinase XerD
MAHDEALIADNPCARIPRPKVHRELQRREVLTVLEYAGYLTAARSLGPARHAIAVLGGMMGLRASEMAGLTVESLTNVPAT